MSGQGGDEEDKGVGVLILVWCDVMLGHTRKECKFVCFFSELYGVRKTNVI